MLSCEGPRALDQATQRGCRIFFSGQIPNPLDYCDPEQTYVGDPALGGLLD